MNNPCTERNVFGNSFEIAIDLNGHVVCYPVCYDCHFTLPFVRRQSAMPKPDPTHLKGGKHTSRKFPATSQLSIKPDESSSQENVNRIITFGSMPSYRWCSHFIISWYINSFIVFLVSRQFPSTGDNLWGKWVIALFYFCQGCELSITEWLQLYFYLLEISQICFLSVTLQMFFCWVVLSLAFLI